MNAMDIELEQELDFLEEPGEKITPKKGEEVNSEQLKIEEDDSFFKEQVKEPEDTIITDLLKARGINDNKLTMLDENEEEIEVIFSELSREEQLEILNATGESLNPDSESLEGLADKEKEFIEHLRKEGISLDEYLEKYKEAAISEVEISAEESYDIDAYTDEELFLLDLKSRYEDLSDDELKKELEKALEDEDIFKKKIDKTRVEYKELEDKHKEEQDRAIEQGKEEQYSKFIDTMVDIAVKNPEFHGIELEDDEKNEVLSYLLELDDKGASEFSRAINDPLRLYEAAWFLKYGKEAFTAIHDAYELEIKELKKDKPLVEKTKVVKKPKPKEGENEYPSIHDLGGF